MRKSLIRINIQGYGSLETSPYSSLFSFKDQIRTSYYPSLDKDHELCLFHKGKALHADGKTLHQVGLVNESNVLATPELKGGASSTFWKVLFWISYLFIILGYFMILFFGLAPLMAYLFDILAGRAPAVINLFLKMFGTNLETLKHNYPLVGIISWICSLLFHIFRYTIVFLFVWAISSYVFFPWMYMGPQGSYDKCKAGITSINVGWWCMIVFGVIYLFMNLPDMALWFLTRVANEDIFVQALFDPAIASLKEIANVTKFIPFYIIPGVEIAHELIDESLSMLFLALDDVSQINCNQGTAMLCELFGTLVSTLDTTKPVTEAANKSRKAKDTVKSIVNTRLKNGRSLLMPQKTKEAYGYHQKKEGEVHEKIQDKKQQLLNSLGKAPNAKELQDIQEKAQQAAIAEGQKVFMASADQYIKDFKLGPAIKIATASFCIKMLDQQGIKDPSNYPANFQWINRLLPHTWQKGAALFIADWVCDLLKSVDAFRNILYSIGTEFQISNMIKVGNLAGVCTIFFFIIVFIIAIFTSNPI